jgi:aspartyl-tRNA(Asn)/glutamyl-tRNA(Gln) amidotransferase subunit C
MHFDKDKIKAGAKMMRITMTDAEATEMIPQMEEIINWMDALDEVNTDDVKPLISTLDFQSTLRKDEVRENGSKEDILAAAPDRCGDFFAVPKVVE